MQTLKDSITNLIHKCLRKLELKLVPLCEEDFAEAYCQSQDELKALVKEHNRIVSVILNNAGIATLRKLVDSEEIETTEVDKETLKEALIKHYEMEYVMNYETRY